jgi:hypothetical protein
VLFRVLAEHLETFLERASDGLPYFVERELRRYLECGILEHGFARVHGSSCGRDALVAFSCKGRGFCPSCGGRRMSDTAAHLADRVLPVVPVRQWVLSFPWRERFLLAYDPELAKVGRLSSNVRPQIDAPLGLQALQNSQDMPVIKAKVRRSARASSLERQGEGTFIASLKAPPVDGKANAEPPLLARYSRFGSSGPGQGQASPARCGKAAAQPLAREATPHGRLSSNVRPRTGPPLRFVERPLSTLRGIRWLGKPRRWRAMPPQSCCFRRAHV